MHTLPSSVHGVPVGGCCAGQDELAPVQVSAGSHSPADGRQMVPGGDSAFAGQPMFSWQSSAASHGPADGRQIEPTLAVGSQLPVQVH